ncbi:uncharacterized protein [Rutidosis leptorrhynchoides]|uniref:uncharacterized protein isoform X2 n=1 Tax=Rutidosis leptorrhynchoides TaxID=125765 RepID=UPI003A998434
MNLMVKYVLLVLQLYAIATSALLQGSSASPNFEPASGPEGTKHLEPSISPKTPLNEPPSDAAAPIMSIPEGSPPSPPVTQPVLVPPIPQPEKGPTIASPVNSPTVSVQITPPPSDALQSPPPVVQAAPPTNSLVPPSMPLASPSSSTSQAPPPSSMSQAPPPSSMSQAPPPSSMSQAPPQPPSMSQAPPPLSISQPSPPSSMSQPPPSMPQASSPSMPQAPPPSMSQAPPSMPKAPPPSMSQPPPSMPQAPPPSMSQVPPSMPKAPPPSMTQVPPSMPQAPPPSMPQVPPSMPQTPPPSMPQAPPLMPQAPPSILPEPSASPPTKLPMASPPPNLPIPVEVPPSTLPTSPPTPSLIPVPPNLPAPVVSPPNTLPINSPPSAPTSTVPPPNLPAPVASPPNTVPRDAPPSPTLTMPPPNSPVPVASSPSAPQRNAPPPRPTVSRPPSSFPNPVALPPSNHNLSMPPPILPEPHISPVSTPSIPSSPNRTTNNIAPIQRSPPPVKAPTLIKAPPPYSSSNKSPPAKSHPPPSLPPLYPPPPPGPKSRPIHHTYPPPDNNPSHPVSPPPDTNPSHPVSPPPDTNPSHPVSPPPDTNPSHPVSPPPDTNPSHPVSSPPTSDLTVPPVENSVPPSIPPVRSPSVQTKMPVFPPRIPKPLQALPPPPPNEDCSSVTCMEPLTNTPPGTPCKCVLPMQVELGVGIALYTFFPLVSELAFEMASGLFMSSSQVRIMGANEDNQDSEKTMVIINLVPLGEKFDNFTAYVTAQRLWLKQVPIKSSLFGDYEVFYVKYPGLPPSPPMPTTNGVNGEPYGHGNNGRDIKPLGVDVSNQRRSNKLSGSVISIISLSAVVAAILVCVAVWVLLVKSRDGAHSGPNTASTLPSVTKSSGVGASMNGSGPESASLSFRSSIHYKGSAKTFSLSDLEKATDNFNELGVLGEGGFGRVYSGVLEDGTKIAVKVLKRDDHQGDREFLAEVEMLSRLHHRNLVRLIGICTEDRNRSLVYELIPNGSVESHLHGVDKETAPLDWGARLKIALGAARGLAYLHEDSSPRVIHRDFKSSNILLEHDFTPKVSDFGLARSALDEENQHISTRVMGTFGYVAPEYAMTGHLLVKSDVYSYGVVLLELLTGRKPVDMSMPSGQENLVAWARPLLPTPEGLNLLIDPSLRPEVPFDSISKVAAIASMCVQPEVSHRPFMGEVVQALKLVCNECEETRDLGSRTCSQEDLTSMDFDPRSGTSPRPGPDPGPSRSMYPSYESPLDVESGISGVGLDVGSYRISSSSGPLRPKRRLQVWEKMKRFSSGSMTDYGDFLRLLSRSR